MLLNTNPARSVVHNVVHLRAAPNSGAEQVSQTLLGRIAHVIETDGAWTRVQTDDTYRGWLETRWLGEGDNEPAHAPLSPVSTVFAEVRELPTVDAPPVLRLPILAGVRKEGRVMDNAHNEWASVVLPDKTRGFLPASALSEMPDGPDEHTPRDAALWWGREFLGTPYLWGGSSSFGLDCSGFVQLCYRLAGNVILRRDADIQRSDPRFAPVEKSDLQAGDLVFFGSPEKITHVGMQYTDGAFIHSSGGAGVVVTRWGSDKYSAIYVDARRLVPEKMHEPPTRHEDIRR